LPATLGSPLSFQVFAPAHTYLDTDHAPGQAGAATVAPFSMDCHATYFLVLVALCEPRLRDVSSVAVLTTPEVVERLKAHPSCRNLT